MLQCCLCQGDESKHQLVFVVYIYGEEVFRRVVCLYRQVSDVWSEIGVAGTSVIERVTARANLRGRIILRIIRKFVSDMGSSVVGNRRICLHNFNDFVVGRHTRGATHGVDEGAAIVIPTRGVPTFGPSGTFTKEVGSSGWNSCVRRRHCSSSPIALCETAELTLSS